MSFRVVIDSCGELTDEMKASGCFKTASLMLQVDDHNIVDDESFDQADFLRRVAASPNCPKSSCPSPEAYRSAFDDEVGSVLEIKSIQKEQRELLEELEMFYKVVFLGESYEDA